MRGLLRIAASSRLPRTSLFPDSVGSGATRCLGVVLLVNDQRHSEGVDVAFCFGSLGDSIATARGLASIERMLVASPLYLRAAGQLKTPADLSSRAIMPCGTFPPGPPRR